jgi:hypothetical protein
MSIRLLSRVTIILLWATAILANSTMPPGDKVEQVRAHTRNMEFNYLSWTLQAMGTKISHSALRTSQYLPVDFQKQLVLEYLELVREVQQFEAQLNAIYTDPSIENPEIASAEVRRDLDELQIQRSRLAPLAEAIIQNQTAVIVAELGLALGGQPIPPILYHSTPLPTSLVVSPREAIRVDASVSLVPDMSVDQRAELEDQVDRDLDVSSLVVNIGGIGLYPTMVMQTSDLNFLAEVVAHEWIHNFFFLRPLGIYYLTSPEARTMNETAATIAGKEIGTLVMERYYPELLPPPPPDQPDEPPPPPVFDFRAEMHLTRITVDGLLAQGKVEEAEAYMEERRVFFWEHGYRHIRKLNQAYFAFYGAYADQPQGPAGEDPVGEAVRQLRANTPTLSDFLYRIAWITTFDQLQQAVDEISS